MSTLELKALFDELRADDLLVVDHPARKLGVFAGRFGQIVVATRDCGGDAVFTLEPEEVTAVCAALLREAHEATATARQINIEYAVHEAIQRASRGGV